MSGIAEVKRRSTRMFYEEEEFSNRINTAQMAVDSKEASIEERGDATSPSRSRSSSKETKARLPLDLGCHTDMFPATKGDKEKHITETLLAAKASTNTKEDARPINFGVVLPGKIYRCSWPTTEDFPYLESLHLKMVLSLAKKDFTPEFQSFIKKNHVAHKVIDMPGTKKIAITKETMSSIMEIVLNEANYPILIHCNHGKHRTGCTVAVIRHVARWPVDSIIEEYQGYAEPKVRDCDVEYITNYNVSSLDGLFVKDTKEDLEFHTTQHTTALTHIIPLTHDEEFRPRVLSLWRRKMIKCIVVSAIALSIWITTGLFWPQKS